MKNNVKSPYGVSRVSSVGSYHGSGIPSKYGTRRFSASFTPTKEISIPKGNPPKKLN